MIELSINRRRRTVDVAPETPVLWALRDALNMTGTKYGCGAGLCGACTMHLDGQAVRSCQILVAEAVGRELTTIEGLSAQASHPVQHAWLDEQVPQCGYCQSGMIMAAAALLATTAKPTDADIDQSITNICRCGTYQRVRAAIHRVATA